MMACKSANAGIKAIKSYGFEESLREKLLYLMVKSSYMPNLLNVLLFV